MSANVMLAEKWDNQDPTGWWMSEKLDGVRAWWTGSSLLSRLGNAFQAPKWFTEKLPNVPLDGELWCGRGQFKEAVSITKSSKRQDDWKYVTYLVFDAPKYDGDFEERMKYLKSVIGPTKTPHARVVGHIKCKGEDHLMKVLKEVEGFGGEGLMLRAAHSMYEHCRSKKLLKVKTFFDEEAKVIGHEKGQGKNADKMGYLICETPDGRQFNVGGGFTDKQRLNPPKIGSVITYKYFELSAALKPRFPIFIGIRNDIDWDEYCKTYKPPTKKVPPALKKTHTIMFSDVLTTSGLEPSSVPSLTNDDDDDSDDIEEYKAAMSSEVGEKSSKSDDKSENEEIIKVDDVKVDKRLPYVKCPYKAIKDDGDDGDDKKMEVMTEEELLSDKQVSPLAVYESQSDLFEGICDDDDDDDDYVYNSDVDDDDDIDDEPQTKKQKIDGDDKRPICKYGDKCYRKNPKHFKLFRHIKIDDTEQKKPEKHKVYLVNENDETFEMNEGSNDIGRGFAGITDQHLSRKQACINVDSVAGAATLSVTGGNASFVKKAGSSNWEKVAQGSTVKLNNNDAIMMVKDSPVFTLKIVAN